MKCIHWGFALTPIKLHYFPPARPSVQVYTEFPEEQGKVNTLYCYATGFYPGDIEMNIFVNGVNVKGETSDLMYGEDWTFRVYKYATITPEPGDEYKCEVKHSSMPEPKRSVRSEFSFFNHIKHFYDRNTVCQLSCAFSIGPEFSESHPYWIYTLFLGILLGIAACVLFRKIMQTLCGTALCPQI